MKDKERNGRESKKKNGRERERKGVRKWATTSLLYLS